MYVRWLFGQALLTFSTTLTMSLDGASTLGLLVGLMGIVVWGLAEASNRRVKHEEKHPGLCVLLGA